MVAEFCVEGMSITDNGPLGNATRWQNPGKRMWPSGFRVTFSIILSKICMSSLFTWHSQACGVILRVHCHLTFSLLAQRVSVASRTGLEVSGALACWAQLLSSSEKSCSASLTWRRSSFLYIFVYCIFCFFYTFFSFGCILLITLNLKPNFQ